MLRLLVKDAVGNLFEYPLDFEELLVGRDEGCNVILDAPDVSRKHTRFFFDQEGYLFVEDLGSAAGTIVDGELIKEPVAIDETSKVLIGSFILFLDNADDELGESDDGFGDLAYDNVARLLVLNGNERGTEYPLTADAIPLGRAGTNAIILDHASLSPEHAQIIKEGGAYVLQDLASRTGTKVNGKEIEEVALRDGDVIQLGAIRMRFMYDREVTRRRLVAKITKQVKLHWKIILPGVGVIIILLVLIGVLVRSGGNTQTSGVVEQDSFESTETDLLGVKNYMSKGKFDEAEKLIQKVLASEPLNQSALNMKKHLEEERKNAKLFNEAAMLFDLGRKEEARQAFRKIPRDSFYYSLAKPKMKELDEQLSRIYLEQGRRAYRRGRFEQAHRFLVMYLAIKPDDSRAVDWVEDCEKHLKSRRIFFKPYKSPKGRGIVRLSLEGIPKILRPAYKRYFAGDIDEALKRLERLIARHRVKGEILQKAEIARKLMLVVRGKFTSGQSSLFQGRIDDAKKEWKAALDADTRIMPPGSPKSFFAREIATNLARGYIEKAQDSVSKEMYEDAFDDFQKALDASPDEIIALRGLLKLESAANRMLEKAKQALDNENTDKARRLCTRAMSITRKNSATHKEAEKLMAQIK
ncbi:MAG: FHA domain-containing protein [Deltaproteobacteria bacterium]|nr:FHA domain-containing protein [Deltaproteobacteria bacterium]